MELKVLSEQSRSSCAVGHLANVSSSDSGGTGLAACGLRQNSVRYMSRPARSSWTASKRSSLSSTTSMKLVADAPIGPARPLPLSSSVSRRASSQAWAHPRPGIVEYCLVSESRTGPCMHVVYNVSCIEFGVGATLFSSLHTVNKTQPSPLRYARVDRLVRKSTPQEATETFPSGRTCLSSAQTCPAVCRAQ